MLGFRRRPWRGELMATPPGYAAGDDTAPDAEPRGEALSSEIAEAQAEENAVDDGEEEEAVAVPAEEAGSETPAPESVAQAPGGGACPEVKKWPGWPGDNVFRLVVPLAKVGSIIGRKGERIKKLCEETRARVRILDGPIGVSDRIVLVSGKEEPEAEISPAMDAVLRIFKCVNGIVDSATDGTNSGSVAPGMCLIRLLVASSQAVNLIGKKGEVIRAIQENSNASVRVLTGDSPLCAAPDERTVEIQGEYLKVLKALEAVVGHLRKFLVDHSVLPLFEKPVNKTVTQDWSADAWGENNQSLGRTAQQSAFGSDYGLPMKRDSFYLDRESHLESQMWSGLTLYGQDPAISGSRSSALGHTGSAIEVTQKMQIPLAYAEDIIGVGGGNISYMRRSSGAVITIEESKGSPDQITVELKGTSSQVHVAQQLIQEFIAERREPLTSRYGELDTGLRPSYSHLANTSHRSSSHTSQYYGGYGSGGYGGYQL